MTEAENNTIAQLLATIATQRAMGKPIDEKIFELLFQFERKNKDIRAVLEPMTSRNGYDNEVFNEYVEYVLSRTRSDQQWWKEITIQTLRARTSDQSTLSDTERSAFSTYQPESVPLKTNNSYHRWESPIGKTFQEINRLLTSLLVKEFETIQS